MPARSTLFQRVVFQIHRQLAPDATVQESALLSDRSTGGTREVDVVVRTTVGEHEIILSVECRDHARKATVEWVEQMATKHHFLPTSKLVLLSAKGFTRAALLKARSLKIDAYSFIEATEQAWAALLHDRADLTFQIWAYRILDVYNVFENDDLAEYPASPKLLLFSADGALLGTLGEVLRSYTERSANFMDRAIDYARSTGETIFGGDFAVHPTLSADHPSMGRQPIKSFRLCMEAMPTPDLHIAAAEYRGAPIVYGHGHSPVGPFTVSFSQPREASLTGAISVVDRETGDVQTESLQFQSDQTKMLFLAGPIKTARKQRRGLTSR